MTKRLSPTTKRSFLPRRAATVAGSAACAAVALLAWAGTPARGQSPAAAAPSAVAGDMKPFGQALPGVEGKLEMVPIPGGTFKLGSPESEKKRKADEGPQVEVKVDPFYMGKYEVTWELYNEFLETYSKLGNGRKVVSIPVSKLADAVSYPTPIYDIDAGPKIQRMGGRGGPFPAVIMSHFAAKQFTKWLSAKTGRFYRLPTEAEWEYAARAGTTTAYSFGDDPKKLEEYGWFTDNSELKDNEAGYHEVGKKKPNPWGLYDMHGNVAEIVIDQYEAEWYKQSAAKGGPVAARDAVRWPDKQYPRTVRGGGYESEPEECRSAARRRITVAQNKDDPQDPKSPYWWTDGFGIGFRVVSPVAEPSAEEKAKYWDVDNEAVAKILGRDREIRQYINEIGPKK